MAKGTSTHTYESQLYECSVWALQPGCRCHYNYKYNTTTLRDLVRARLPRAAVALCLPYSLLLPLSNSSLPPASSPGKQLQWMSAPQETIPGCPPGLEYLTQIDQLLVHQQVEIFEGMFKLKRFSVEHLQLTSQQ